MATARERGLGPAVTGVASRVSAHPGVRKAWWMSSRISQRIRRRWNQCRWAKAVRQPSVECRVPSRVQCRVPVLVVAAVAEHDGGAAPESVALAPHGRHCLEQWNELGDVVAVASGEGDGERDAGGIGDQVVLGACSPSRPRSTGLRPVLGPFFALMWGRRRPPRRSPGRPCCGGWPRALRGARTTRRPQSTRPGVAST